MATQVASLYGLLALDDRDFVRGLNSADQGIQTLAGKIDKFSAKINSVGVGITAMTQPLRDFGMQGIAAASTFDSTMAEIAARTGLAGAELEKMRQFALQMGADTSFSGQQAADAMLQLLTSGQSATEAMATLPAILNAAAASGEELGTTADVITDIMAAFGLETDDAAGVVNILAKAAGASSADMSSLGQGFANVGGVAKQFGLSVQDTAAVLAIFSENGVKGAEAGTQLKSMLLNMTRPTEEVQGTWKKLGVSFYDAMGNARPLTNVMADLKVAMAGMPAEEQNAIMQKLGGSYGVVGMTALMGSISIDDMQASMRESAGAGEVAAARMDTFAGASDSLMGSIETLQITALTPFMENVLKPMIQTVTEVVNSITTWAGANPELTSTIVAILGVVAVAGPALLGLGAIMGGLGTVVGMVSGAIAFLVSPIGIAIAAAAALGAAYMTNFGGIRDFIDTQVAPRLNAFFGWLGGVWEGTIKPGLQALYNWFVVEGLPAVATFVETQVLPKIQAFFGFIEGVWALISPALTSIYDWFVTTGLPAISEFITGTVQPAVENFFNFVGGIWELTGAVLGKFFDWFMVDGLPAIQGFIETTVQPAFDTFINFLKGIWTAVKPGFDAFKTGVQSVLGPVLTLINNIKTQLDSLGGGLGAYGDVGKNASQIAKMSQNVSPGDFFSIVGGSIANQFKPPSRDSGGSGQAGQSYLIGTGAQPELFTPQTAGNFTPAGKMGTTINVSVSAATVNDTANTQRNAESFAEALERAMRAKGLA